MVENIGLVKEEGEDTQHQHQKQMGSVAIKDINIPMPFDTLNSLHVTAIVLQYVGTKKVVCRLLQLLTHTSRAYCK